VLTVGLLVSYDGEEIPRAIPAFSAQYPAVTLNVASRNHQELYAGLRFGRIDLALNDQRRAFSVDPIRRTYYSFWKKGTGNPCTASFAELLQDQFT